MSKRILILSISLIVWIGLSSFWYTCKIQGLCSNNSKIQAIADPVEMDAETLVTEENNIVRSDVDTLEQATEDLIEQEVTLDNEFIVKEVTEEAILEEVIAEKEVAIIQNKRNEIANKVEVVKKPSIPRVKCPTVSLDGSEPQISPILFGYATTEVYCTLQLKQFAKSAKTYLDTYGGKIILTGHTDTGPKSINNFTLGLKRAISVKKILIKEGLSANQIETYSRSDAEPVADNATANGKQQNRRVTIDFN